MAQTLKSWATPLAVGAFTISAVTGLLIFFDLELGIIEPVHKWLSWLLVTGVILHLVSNWKQFTGYFSKKPALGIIGAALIVTIASLLPVFGEKEEGKERTGKVAAVNLLYFHGQGKKSYLQSKGDVKNDRERQRGSQKVQQRVQG
jgi:Domain of unknown function (DUF4405)